jgi:hypothetical protein
MKESFHDVSLRRREDMGPEVHKLSTYRSQSDTHCRRQWVLRSETCFCQRIHIVFIVASQPLSKELMTC